uniref:Uncharacterized protein n=1 Tax=Lepeophtheirus salmonis TaxID=72036 RepID=A0A0K2T1Q9_LEPSM
MSFLFFLTFLYLGAWGKNNTALFLFQLSFGCIINPCN